MAKAHEMTEHDAIAVRSTDELDGQTPLTREAITQRIARELDRAYSKHGREQWGRHEFYAILREEVDELWDAIRGDHDQHLVAAEAIQIAAMVFRYLETGDRYRQPSNGEIRCSEPEKLSTEPQE